MRSTAALCACACGENAPTGWLTGCCRVGGVAGRWVRRRHREEPKATRRSSVDLCSQDSRTAGREPLDGRASLAMTAPKNWVRLGRRSYPKVCRAASERNDEPPESGNRAQSVGDGLLREAAPCRSTGPASCPRAPGRRHACARWAATVLAARQRRWQPLARGERRLRLVAAVRAGAGVGEFDGDQIAGGLANGLQPELAPPVVGAIHRATEIVHLGLAR